jgi:parallel beta-helix repeat protein
MRLALALAVGLAAPAQAAVVCVNPNDPTCFATLQAGVVAAVAGDVVQAAHGLYPETVTIGTPGITLRGSPGSIIAACGAGGTATGITVTAADVAIEAISIVSPAGCPVPGLRLSSAANARVSDAVIQAPEGVCVEMTGATPGVVIERSQLGCAVKSEDSDGLRLLGNRFRAGSARLNGDGVVAERNSFLAGGVSVEGADANLTGNTLDDSGGLAVVGNRDANGRPRGKATVTWNIVRSGEGILVDTDGPVIEGNAVLGGGITVSCEAGCPDGRVVRNRISRAREGIRALGPVVNGALEGPRIEANLIQHVAGHGIVLDETLAAHVVRNRVTDTAGYCITLPGADENTVSGNTLTGCAAGGIHVFGDENTVERNRISGTSDDGIDVGRTGNAVLGNRVSGALDNGIKVGGSATTVSGNQAEGLHADYCDGGSGTLGSDVPDSTTGCGDFD